MKEKEVSEQKIPASPGIITVTETEPMPTPSPTFYSQLAANLIAALDQVTAAVPNFEDGVTTKDFVSKKRRVPPAFIVDAISALKVNGDLHNVKALNVLEAMDDSQYVEAFEPVIRHLQAALAGLEFSVAGRKARLAATAQKIYAISKALVRDRENTSVGIAVHVNNMKRSLRPSRRRKGDEPGKEGDTVKTDVPQQK